MSAIRWKTPEQVAEKRLQLLDTKIMDRLVDGKSVPANVKSKRAALKGKAKRQ